MTVDLKFQRGRHGGLYDRGGADCYYGRPRDPHWCPQGTGNGAKEKAILAEEIAEYDAGYDEQERSGVKKGY